MIGWAPHRRRAWYSCFGHAISPGTLPCTFVVDPRLLLNPQHLLSSNATRDLHRALEFWLVFSIDPQEFWPDLEPTAAGLVALEHLEADSVNEYRHSDTFRACDVEGFPFIPFRHGENLWWAELT